MFSICSTSAVQRRDSICGYKLAGFHAPFVTATARIYLPIHYTLHATASTRSIPLVYAPVRLTAALRIYERRNSPSQGFRPRGALRGNSDESPLKFSRTSARKSLMGIRTTVMKFLTGEIHTEKWQSSDRLSISPLRYGVRQMNLYHLHVPLIQLAERPGEILVTEPADPRGSNALHTAVTQVKLSRNTTLNFYTEN